jgi:hypothetical protein
LLATTISALRRSIARGEPLSAVQRSDALNLLDALGFAIERAPSFAPRLSQLSCEAFQRPAASLDATKPA